MNADTGGRSATLELNVTPLVDVILVLIVMFMVITPVVPKGFTGKLPERAQGPRSQALVVEVAADGGLRLNQQPVPEGELGERVAAALVGQSSRALFLKAEDGVTYDRLVAVMDACYGEGGASAVAFVPE